MKQAWLGDDEREREGGENLWIGVQTIEACNKRVSMLNGVEVGGRETHVSRGCG